MKWAGALAGVTAATGAAAAVVRSNTGLLPLASLTAGLFAAVLVLLLALAPRLGSYRRGQVSSHHLVPTRSPDEARRNHERS